jgi:hypothetical protein
MVGNRGSALCFTHPRNFSYAAVSLGDSLGVVFWVHGCFCDGRFGTIWNERAKYGQQYHHQSDAGKRGFDGSTSSVFTAPAFAFSHPKFDGHRPIGFRIVVVGT